MAWSRSARIKTLLAIDTVFLFIELITGYAVGSLALVADSFHMLNDVMSLIVALYALKLAENSTRSNKYSYGWQRAEILGALVNGVFLLALCFSIFMEAIQRMFEGPEVKSPHIVVIVGSLGLLSNIVGLFLFHEHGHGHSHGGHSHSHDAKAEEGHSHAVTTFSAAKKGKNGHAASNGNGTNGQASERTPLLGSAANAADLPALSSQQKQQQQQGAAQSQNLDIGGTETPYSDITNESESGDDALDELLVHPARTREAIVRQAYDAGFGSGSPRNSTGDGFGSHRRTSSFQSASKRGRSRTESTSFKGRERSASRGSGHGHEGHDHAHPHDEEDDHDHNEHDEHDHEHDHDDGDDHGHGHGGHSHGNMNMQGVFLHVLGDALGNVGVIAAGLIIWLTKSPYRFYSDPVISFVITIIIFSSALPLVRSASFILLQGTPAHVPLEKVRSAILRIPNVISVHDLHIWSLSESKLVASMHILVKSHEEFAACSQSVRKVLHRFGVHSTTIQPELLDLADPTTQTAVGIIMSRQGSRERLGVDDDDEDVGCMAQCIEDSCVDNSCCPPNSMPAAALPGKSNTSTPPRPPGSGGPSYAAVASGH